jgi:hypothetical protein
MIGPPTSCAAQRAMVVCRRAAGPFNARICEICASMGSQPAALHVPTATDIFSENRLVPPMLADTRHGAFLQVRSTSNRCAPARQSALWAGRLYGVSSLALKAHDWPCPAKTRGSLRSVHPVLFECFFGFSPVVGRLFPADETVHDKQGSERGDDKHHASRRDRLIRLKLLLDHQADGFRPVVDAPWPTPGVDLRLHALGHHDRDAFGLQFGFHGRCSSSVSTNLNYMPRRPQFIKWPDRHKLVDRSLGHVTLVAQQAQVRLLA